MSKYTTQVRFICERAAGFSESADYADVDDILTAAVPKVFSFDFPIFDENYREVLCKKILKHYYTREIGLETVGLWKLKLDTKLNEIMPYYNERYRTTVYEFNPLYDADYTRTTQGTDSGTNEGESSSLTSGSGNTGNTRTLNTSEVVTESGTVETDRTGTGSVQHGYNSTESLDEDRDRRETHTGTDTQTKTGTIGEVTDRDDDKEHGDAYSDTPQGTIDNVMQGTYLTNYRHVLDSEQEDINKTTTFNTTDQETRNLNNSAVEDNSATRTWGGNDTDSETRNFKDKTTESKSMNKSDTGSITDAGTHTESSRTDGTNSGSFETTKDYVEHVVGKMPGHSYARAIMEFRDSIINIDMEIIEELSDLFMKVW